MRKRGSAVTDASAPDGRSQRRIENQKRIYDAAMRLLRERAYADLTVDEICEAAGVGRATFFRIFEHKAGLLREFNRRLALRIRERLDDEAPLDAASKLQIVTDEAVSTWSRAGSGAAEMALDFMRSSRPADAHRVHPEALDIAIEIVEAGMKAGEIRRSNPALLTASLALIQIAAATAYWLEHPETNLRELANEAMTTLLHGVLVDEPQR